MNSKHNIRLTSAEIAQLWNGYMNNSMAKCTLMYFKEKTQDEEIRTVIDFAITMTDKILKTITEIYVKENHPIPVAFNENEDVNLNAPALYSDTYFLNFILNMSRYGLTAYGAALSGCTRSDVLALFSSALDLTRDLYFNSLNVSLEKGLSSRAAYIPIPEKVEFIEKQGYLTGWFGERRPINSLEIMHFYENMERNAVGKALLLGFAQVAESKEVQNYMIKGANIASKVVEVLSHILAEENISESPTYDSEVLKSTTPPFSDKLMMFQVSMLTGMSLGHYGTAIGTVARRDLGSKFIRLFLEAVQFAEDGANIMIEHGWMEKPPASIDEFEIAKTKRK